MASRLVSTWKELGTLGPIAIFMVAGPGVGAAVLAAVHERWLPPLQEMGWHGLPWFLGVTALLCGLSLLTNHAGSLLGGMLYGPWWGSLWALVASGGAAWIGFLVLRPLCRSKALEALSHRPRLEALHAELTAGHTTRAILLVALIRMSPLLPFAATNLLMATTTIRAWAFVVGSILGMIPRVLMVAWIGSTLTELDWSRAEDRRLFYIGVASAVLVFAMVRALAKKAWASQGLAEE
ncbi:MAG: VTT domain-containing protein [Planctomycetota bacterium]